MATDAEGSTLYAAIKHVLDQIQTNPDLSYQLIDTESFRLLVKAEAEVLGLPEEHVKLKRRVDAQPRHRRRRAEVEVMKQLLEERFPDYRSELHRLEKIGTGEG